MCTGIFHISVACVASARVRDLALADDATSTGQRRQVPQVHGEEAHPCSGAHLAPVTDAARGEQTTDLSLAAL